MNVPQRLRSVQPSGLLGATVQYAVCSGIWAFQAAKLAIQYVRSPAAFNARKDRSALDAKEPMQGVVHEYISVNGLKIHAASLGRQPSKPLMLFLHGFPEFWYSWRFQLPHYSKDYDAVAIDMRGYGLSDKPKGVHNYKLDVLASDVAGVVKALGHEKCVLVAHDWGAGVAWVVAGMYPEVVDRLVCMAGPHMGLVQSNMTLKQAFKSWYILYFQCPWLPELALSCFDYAWLGAVLRKGTPIGPTTDDAFTESDREWYKHAQARPGATTATLNYYRALLPHATYAPIPRVYDALRQRLEMPVLAMMADKDGALEPGLMAGLEEIAEHSESHVIQNSSHWVQNDQPAEVHKLMDAFLAKYPPSRSKL